MVVPPLTFITHYRHLRNYFIKGCCGFLHHSIILYHSKLSAEYRGGAYEKKVTTDSACRVVRVAY